MKIRTGFVSNSSSTSFVVVCSDLHGEVYSKARELIKAGRLYAEGSWCCEGVDFFKVTQEMWEMYEKGATKGYFDFYDVQTMDEESVKIKKSNIEGDEFEVHIFDIDQRRTANMLDFEDRYSDEED